MGDRNQRLNKTSGSISVGERGPHGLPGTPSEGGLICISGAPPHHPPQWHPPPPPVWARPPLSPEMRPSPPRSLPAQTSPQQEMNPSTSTQCSCFNEADSHTGVQSNLPNYTVLVPQDKCAPACVCPLAHVHTHTCAEGGETLSGKMPGTWEQFALERGRKERSRGRETHLGGLCASHQEHL